MVLVLEHTSYTLALSRCY